MEHVKIGSCQEFKDWTERASREVVLPVVSRLAFRALPLLTIENDCPLEHVLHPASFVCLGSYGTSFLGIEQRSDDIMRWSSSTLLEIAEHNEGPSARIANMLCFAGHSFLTGDIWEDNQLGEPSLPDMAGGSLDILFEVLDMSELVFLAIEKDILDQLHGKNLPLWHDETPAGRLRDADQKLLHFFDGGKPQWTLLGSWYRAVKNGQVADVNLLNKALSLSTSCWESGPLAVYKELALDAGAKVSHAEPKRASPILVKIDLIVENPITSYSIAKSVSDQISSSIEHYLSSTKENSLPDEFTPLERMPRALMRAAVETVSPKPEHDVIVCSITELAEELCRLESALADKGPSMREKFSGALAESAGRSIGDWKMYGALFAALGLWMDGDFIKNTIERLAGNLEDIFPRESDH